MPERLERLLKIACGLLALLLCYQCARVLFHGSPLSRLRIPALPSLPETAAVTPEGPAATGSGPLMNRPPTADRTQPTAAPVPGGSTNPAAHGSNPPPAVPVPSPAPRMVGPAAMGGMRVMPGLGGAPGMPKVELPPAVRSQVDRITESELLAPVIRPLPMALLGIAGKDAFIRAANGQTGLLREGGELGGLKLLQIGTNRVLIEENGVKKELTVFSGYGGESLLPQPSEKAK